MHLPTLKPPFADDHHRKLQTTSHSVLTSFWTLLQSYKTFSKAKIIMKISHLVNSLIATASNCDHHRQRMCPRQPIKDNPWHKRVQLRDTCLSTVRGTDASARYLIQVILCAQYHTYTHIDRNEYESIYNYKEFNTRYDIGEDPIFMMRSQIADNWHWGRAPSIIGVVEVSWMLWWKETEQWKS